MSLDVRRISFVALAAFLIAIPLVSRAQDPADSRRLTRAAAVERRLALVIGNNAYTSAPLRNAIADAQAVSAALREAGFEVTLLTDVPLAAMERAVDAFAGRGKQFPWVWDGLIGDFTLRPAGAAAPLPAPGPAPAAGQRPDRLSG